MNNGDPNEDLLIRYLANELDAEETLSVETWISASQKNKEIFEEFSRIWDLSMLRKSLDQVLDPKNLEAQWQRFQRDISEREDNVEPVSNQAELKSRHDIDEEPKQKSKVYRLLIGSAIAASVLLLVGLGWKIWFQAKEVAPIAKSPGKNTDSISVIVHHEVNTTGQEKSIELSDGSTVLLAHNSELIYLDPFIDKREVTLIGKAYFKVSHDQTKPFIVTSGDLTTTVLGTEFTVTAFKNTHKIFVRLYEGKVVVHPVEKNNWRMKEAVYLLPGQELVYSDDALAKVTIFQKGKATKNEKSGDKDPDRDNPLIPQISDGSWYMFNNQALGQVLDQLAALYHVEIFYNKKDVQKTFWTGQYQKSDSIETILKRIGQMHNLTVTKKDGKFFITK